MASRKKRLVCPGDDVTEVVVPDCGQCGEVAEFICHSCNTALCVGCFTKHVKETADDRLLVDV